MGLQNVFANDVVTDRPVALEQLTIGTVERRSVVQQCIKPDVGHKVAVKRQFDSPGQA